MDLNKKNLNSYKILECRICNSKEIIPIIDLEDQPLANSLKNNKNDYEEFYPLQICQCRKCSVIQLTETVKAEILFNKYVWVTGTSKVANKYSQIFYERASNFLNSKENFVVEVASNDGTFLQPFKESGFKVLGVDPAQNIAQIANQKGIDTKAEFFGTKSSESIIKAS